MYSPNLNMDPSWRKNITNFKNVLPSESQTLNVRSFLARRVCHCVKRSEKPSLQGMDTYPTLGKGKSSSKCHFWGIC